MERSTFLLIAGAVAIMFSLNMMFAGSQMTKMVVLPTNQSTLVVLQWMGAQLFAVGAMTVLSRHDPGSPALRAVLIGSIVMHALGMLWDTIHYFKRFVTVGALVMGVIVHVSLGGGSLYYLLQMTGT